MADFKFRINYKIDVLWNNSIYKTNIQDINNNYISISIPMSEGKYLPLAKGDLIEGIYYDEPNLYKFATIVKDRATIDNVPQIYIAIPESLKKVQRRNYVRVDLVDYVNYIKINHDFSKNLNFNEEDYEKAILLDISGGGMRIKTKNKVSLGEFFLTVIKNENLDLITKGRVVRIEPLEEGYNECGISFMDIDDTTREKIIQFVFLMMRKKRKAALGED